MSHEVELAGCTPEPLMSYLKALGVLRLVAEQADPDATACWRSERFVLRSKLDEDRLVQFFLNHYEPTPIIAPWGARSGFYPGSSETTARRALEAIMASRTPRLRRFRIAISQVRTLLQQLGLSEKARDEEKLRLMRICRAQLPDEILEWLDTCYVLTRGDRKFPPLLGTGGNEGSGSYVSGFAQIVVACIVNGEDQKALRSALFGGPAPDVSSKQTPGHFSPFAAGGANQGQGFEGGVLTNPWDYLLCIEGSCLWASGVVRRCGGSGPLMASFPFTFNVTGAGGWSLSESDSRKPKQAKRLPAEMWLPVWSRFVSLGELRSLLSEGRASVGKRLAVTGTDMTRSVASLGVDRGIDSFVRVVFLMRHGQSFLAVATGRQKVRRHAHASLLRESRLDSWLSTFIARCTSDTSEDMPARFRGAKRAIESAIFDYCRYGRREDLQNVLIALGQAERELAITGGKRGNAVLCPPLGGVSHRWIPATHDGSLEYDIALALAGIHDREGKLPPIRANVEPVQLQGNWWSWSKEVGPEVVWKTASLTGNMIAVLERRIMDGLREGCETLPLDFKRSLSLEAIALFLAGDSDDERINLLFRSLLLIDHRAPLPEGLPRPRWPDAPPLPRQYALLKLLFLPAPLTVEIDPETERPHWRLAQKDERGIVIRPEPRVLPLLRAGRVGEACRLAYERLRACGLEPVPSPMGGRPARVHEWAEAGSTVEAHRLAAALLLPISSESVNRILHLVTRTIEDPEEAESLLLEPEGV